MLLRRIAIALAVTLASATVAGQASAQSPGYLYGVGLSYSNGCGSLGRGSSIQDGKRPPYFALHPPVYYSKIVPRPYGISPFAAPPGVTPTEMIVTPEPVTISNPFYKREMTTPVDTNKKKQPSNKVTFISNPFLQMVKVSKEPREAQMKQVRTTR